MNTNYYLIIYPLFFLGTILFSFLINGLFLKFASTLGIRNANETVIRWSSYSNPSVGGISFYIIFLLSVAAHFIFFEQGKAEANIQFIGIISSVTLAFLIGLADDAFNTNPLLKFTGQLVCGLIIVFTGTTINISSSEMFNGILTVFWIIGIMNSLNMLDNMDAITTIVSIFIILAALMIGFVHQEFFSVYSMLLVGVLAALIGFLFYNWNPSKIFMGDTGSQFLGCLIGIFGIIYFWNYNDSIGASNNSQQIIIVALAFLIPFSDTSAVVINRLKKKQSPFVGGKDHTTHHISYLGFSDKSVARIFIIISVVSLLFVFLIVNFIDHWNYIHFILFSIYFFLMFSALYMTTRITKKNNNNSSNNISNKRGVE